VKVLKNVYSDPWGEYECFNVKTYIRDSVISSAGRARVTMEMIPQGMVIRRCKVHFDCFPTNEKNSAFALRDVASINNFLDFPDFPGKPSNIEQINNFACTPFNTLPSISRDYVYWWQPVCYFNHASGSDSNVFIQMTRDGSNVYFEMRSLKDIPEGHELFIDYRNFELPQWFKDYNNSMGFVTTDQLGTKISGERVDDEFTINLYRDQHEAYNDFITSFYILHEVNGNDFAIKDFMQRLPNKGKVLDVGCSSGWHSNMFYDAGFEVTAIDASEKVITELDEKLNPKLGRFETIDYVDTFDGIILSWMLHHLQREGIDNALQRIRRALKDDGLIYISTVEGNEDYRDSIGRLYSVFTESELTQLLEKHNFVVKHSEKHELNHFEDTPMTGLVVHAQCL
jgi:2-polyprenyl-3-methyl-5-hydroxy-6-metoxy-1,4-benzoquinol methylase